MLLVIPFLLQRIARLYMAEIRFTLKAPPRGRAAHERRRDTHTHIHTHTTTTPPWVAYILFGLKINDNGSLPSEFRI